MAGRFRTKTKGKGKGKRYPVGGRESTSLDIGKDKGSKSGTDLFSGGALDGPTSLDGAIEPEKKDLFGGDTRIDALDGETSLALNGGKVSDKRGFSVVPSDDWADDPDRRGEKSE